MTLTYGQWDTHVEHFLDSKNTIPAFDRGVTALVQDLHDRGLDKDVTVIAWGEFGRTPKINANVGRDHWPRVMSVLLAGGGMRVGQVIGKTDGHAGEPVERPIHYQEVFATLYHNLGLNPLTTTIADPTGRPHYLVEHRDPVPELI